jgi:hypothetical protein
MERRLQSHHHLTPEFSLKKRCLNFVGSLRQQTPVGQTNGAEKPLEKPSRNLKKQCRISGANFIPWRWSPVNLTHRSSMGASMMWPRFEREIKQIRVRFRIDTRSSVSIDMGTSPESLAVYHELPRQRGRVLATVANSADGLTRQEISGLSGLGLPSVCARVNELLAQKALIEQPHPSGVGCILRQNKTGRWASILIISPSWKEVPK